MNQLLKKRENVRGALGGSQTVITEIREPEKEGRMDESLEKRPTITKEKEKEKKALGCGKYSMPQGFSSQLQAYSGSQSTETFAIDIQNVFDPEDLSKIWGYQVPVLTTNEKEVFIQVNEFQSCITNFSGDTFPSSISIGIRGFSGLITNDGESNKIIKMTLNQVTTRESSGGFVTRDLVYSSNIQANWSLGSLRNLAFELYVDDDPSPLNMPLQNPLSIAFKIIHVSY